MVLKGGRPRGHTWSSPSMLKKGWQGAMENLEKRVMDSMEYFNKMMKKMEERDDKMKQEQKKMKR